MTVKVCWGRQENEWKNLLLRELEVLEEVNDFLGEVWCNHPNHTDEEEEKSEGSEAECVSFLASSFTSGHQ